LERRKVEIARCKAWERVMHQASAGRQTGRSTTAFGPAPAVDGPVSRRSGLVYQRAGDAAAAEQLRYGHD
jgi:hypothetical protein